MRKLNINAKSWKIDWSQNNRAVGHGFIADHSFIQSFETNLSFPYNFSLQSGQKMILECQIYFFGAWNAQYEYNNQLKKKRFDGNIEPPTG